MIRTRRVLPAILLGMLAGVLPMQASASHGCTDSDAGAHPVTLSSGATGQYTLPDSTDFPAPTSLAVFAHGYGHRSDSWVEHMKRTSREGAVAVAMDYRGTYDWVDPSDNQTYIRGWFVTEGAQDSIDAAQHFLASCSSITDVYLYGVSMGGNTSGLAVAAKAERTAGVPLFDYWIAGEPAANVIETHTEATAVGPANAFAVRAREDIEQQFGGSPAEQPAAYAAGTVVLRAQDIAGSGIKGVAIVHGPDDGLVPYNQARELSTTLRALGVPTDFYNALRRNDGDPDHEGGTTLSENVGKPLFSGLGLGAYPEPIAGHGTESSQTHIVIQTGLDILFALINGGGGPDGSEYAVDGQEGVIKLV